MEARRIARWVELVSWGFVALGVLLPVAATSATFAPWTEALARACFGTADIPTRHLPLLTLMLGITGGSIAGKWMVHARLARGPLAAGHAWARDLTLRGLAAWFLVDSVASAALGAAFNVWMINLLPVVLVGLPMVLGYSAFDAGDAARPVDRGASRADAAGTAGLAPGVARAARCCAAASLFGAGTGVAIAAGGTTPLFAPWFAGLEAAHYDGLALGSDARRLALAFFGPIGGCTVAQFLMLAGLARQAPGQASTPWTGAASIAAWFAVDSAWGLANRGLFNVLLVNVPAVVATLPPWLLLGRALAARESMVAAAHGGAAAGTRRGGDATGRAQRVGGAR